MNTLFEADAIAKVNRVDAYRETISAIIERLEDIDKDLKKSVHKSSIHEIKKMYMETELKLALSDYNSSTQTSQRPLKKSCSK